MTKTKRHAKVTLGIALCVAMAHLVGLLGCSKRDESNATSKSNSYSQLDSRTPVPSAAPSDVEGLAANGMLESRATDQEDEAVGDDEICYRGDKYIAIPEVKMKQGGLDEEYLSGKIDSFFEDINRIRQIIRHIRIFSREQNDVVSTKVDVNETITNALSLVRTQYKNHNIKMILKLSEEPCFTLGNKYRIEQVLLNLLSNAKDAVEEKATLIEDFKKEIEITSFSKDKKSYILLKDNGVGIGEGDIEHIFEPFYTTKDEESGTGLGLSIVYGILEEMKANLKVRSEAGEYTEMILEMPFDG